VVYEVISCFCTFRIRLPQLCISFLCFLQHSRSFNYDPSIDDIGFILFSIIVIMDLRLISLLSRGGIRISGILSNFSIRQKNFCAHDLASPRTRPRIVKSTAFRLKNIAAYYLLLIKENVLYFSYVSVKILTEGNLV
jgi:hypothetical protein